MSAFMCSRDHIVLLAVEAERCCTHNPDLDSVKKRAVSMYRANCISLEARYPRDFESMVTYSDDDIVVTFDDLAQRRDPVAVLKLARSYGYQCCEFSGWSNSDGCRQMELAQEHAITNLPGYHDAPWEI